MEQLLVINNGAFTKAGNFRGYTATGKDVHIFPRQLDAIGITKETKIDFPLYVIADDKTYGAPIDATTGQPVPYADGSFTMTRRTALSVFKSRTDIKTAIAEERTLEMEIEHEVNAFAKSLAYATPSDATMEELQTNAAF
jgi:hypothetical protein